jgi:hypothetical protein
MIVMNPERPWEAPVALHSLAPFWRGPRHSLYPRFAAIRHDTSAATTNVIGTNYLRRLRTPRKIAPTLTLHLFAFSIASARPQHLQIGKVKLRFPPVPQCLRSIEASHIRSFPRALATHENDVLHLAIKQYTPLINPNPQEGDITIIAAHANAFPKVSSSNIALNRTFQCISSLPSLKMLYQHGCVVSTADLTNVGTLRTTLG